MGFAINEGFKMTLKRIIKGKCGTTPVFGGAVVECPRFGEYYATRKNSATDLIAVVASCDPRLIRAAGLRKFTSPERAMAYAKSN